ncbi:MAG: glycosyltransferase family protein [Sediminibacterium sp.]
MKIFYAIQGTGNGHLSRAEQLYPYLKKFGEVDFFLSGSNSQLQTTIPIKYYNHGLSLHYKNSGGLDYSGIAKSISFKLYKDAKMLPIDHYDLIINDFEFVTSLACSIKRKKSVQFGHQASFQSKLTPRAKTINPIGKLVLENFVKSSSFLGLHFESYDKNIYNPIIKDEIVVANKINDGHISVYLPQFTIEFITPFLHAQSQFHFEVFTKQTTQIKNSKNVTYFPISSSGFTNSLIRCFGIITAGGFETPAEAMYLNKKLLSIPILNHFEQECNAAAMKKMGVTVLKKIDHHFGANFKDWINQDYVASISLTHATQDIVQILMNNAFTNV